jgi:hypothetical protein
VTGCVVCRPPPAHQAGLPEGGVPGHPVRHDLGPSRRRPRSGRPGGMITGVTLDRSACGWFPTGRSRPTREPCASGSLAARRRPDFRGDSPTGSLPRICTTPPPLGAVLNRNRKGPVPTHNPADAPANGTPLPPVIRVIQRGSPTPGRRMVGVNVRRAVAVCFCAVVNVTMLLADAAEAVGGKLYILGGGWSVMGPGPGQMAIALRFEVPWHEAAEDHDWTLSLVDADGRPVLCEDHQRHPIQHHGHFHVHRDENRLGVPVEYATVANAGRVRVPPGGRYVWELSVDGATREHWRVAFSSRSERE